MRDLLLLTIIIVSIRNLEASISEPHCACSKFPYEEKLLEKMVRMEFAVERMKNEMENAEQKVRKVLEEFQEIRSQHQETVKRLTDKKSPAFTATLSTDLSSLRQKDTIVFDNVVTNIGLAYSRKTGVFTAPTNGVYYFIATVMCENGGYVEAEIVQNGQSMVKTYALDTTFEQGTSGVVLQLETSDEVWVRVKNGNKVNGHNWTSFSGFQISD